MTDLRVKNRSAETVADSLGWRVAISCFESRLLPVRAGAVGTELYAVHYAQLRMLYGWDGGLAIERGLDKSPRIT